MKFNLFTTIAIFRYDHAERLTAEEGLQHAYFQPVRENHTKDESTSS